MARFRVLVLDGPNLDLLGSREPEVYGRDSLESVREQVTGVAEGLGCGVAFAQSNDEGRLIELLHGASREVDGVVLNPGALGHYSYALRDAVAAAGIPVIEVHLSNVFAREDFRRQLVIAPLATGLIVGLGPLGYRLALEALVGVLAGRTQRS